MANKRFFRHLLNFPFLWIAIVPLAIADLFGEIYHQTGFRLCKIPLVKRSQYIKIDRHKLKYLRLSTKIGCMYCGYANGFMQYYSEILARSERYWCAIKHQKSKDFIEPEHHKNFAEYGDEKAYKR